VRSDSSVRDIRPFTLHAPNSMSVKSVGSSVGVDLRCRSLTPLWTSRDSSRETADPFSNLPKIREGSTSGRKLTDHHGSLPQYVNRHP
jgi:hypothetical protein